MTRYEIQNGSMHNVNSFGKINNDLDLRTVPI
jgi:hypothetical protein